MAEKNDVTGSTMEKKLLGVETPDGSGFSSKYDAYQYQVQSNKNQSSVLVQDSSQNTSPGIERIQSFSELKHKFETCGNNNEESQGAAPCKTLTTSFKLEDLRHLWTSLSVSTGSRPINDVFDDKHSRPNDLSVIREKIANAKKELAEANHCREVAEQGIIVAKQRITQSKQKSKLLRDQLQIREDDLNRKERKLSELKKRLAAKEVQIQETHQTMVYYKKDIEQESELIEQLLHNIEKAKIKKRENVREIRSLAHKISPLKANIVKVETRLEEAQKKSRRFEDILTKLSIKLRNTRTMQEYAARRTSFKGSEIKDVKQKIREKKEQLKKAKTDINFVEYRKELLTEQLRDWKNDIDNLVMRLNPYRQQRALGFIYTRIPMSEEL